MPVDLLHSFPLTHEQSVKILLSAPWTEQEREWVRKRSLVTLFHPVGDSLRKHWYLDDRTYPLPRYYMKNYALGNGGDMASLIILDWLAKIQGESFNMRGYVQAFKRNWLDKGIDPLTLEKIPRKT